MLQVEQPSNQRMELTIPDAAQSVAGAPLCLLSGLAAHAHVRGIGEAPTLMVHVSFDHPDHHA